MKTLIRNVVGQLLMKLLQVRFLKLLGLIIPILGASASAENLSVGFPAPSIQLSTGVEQSTEQQARVSPAYTLSRKTMRQGSGKRKGSSSELTHNKKVGDQDRVVITSGLNGIPQARQQNGIVPWRRIINKALPMEEGELFRYSPLPPLALPDQRKGQTKSFSDPSTLNYTNSAILQPGLYLAEPYSMLVFVPPSGIDEKMVIGPKGDPAAEPVNQMPTVKPELRLRPLQK